MFHPEVRPFVHVPNRTFVSSSVVTQFKGCSLLVFILFYFNSSQNKTSENETMFLYFLRMFPDSLELHQDPFVSKYKMTLELHITLN